MSARTPRGSRRRTRTGCALALAALAGVAAACNEVETRPLPAREEAALPVQAEAVRRGAITARIVSSGSLEARRSSRIGPRVAGRLLEVLVQEADRVEAGAPLFRLDPATFEAAVERAEAGLDLARAERRQIALDLERSRKLLEEDYLSRQQVDRLETRLAVAQARERQAAQAVAIARRDLDDTLVRAPFAGSVAERLVDEGSTVGPQTTVVVLQETALLEARTAIAETRGTDIRPGDRARIRVEGVAEPIETTVATVGDTIDPTTRTYLVRALVPNADRRLKAGVFAEMEIFPRSREDVLLVRRDALRTLDGEERVLVVRDGRAVAVDVEVGVVTDEAMEIRGGLAPGERVIVGEAARMLAPGTKVRVERAAARSAAPAPVRRADAS